VGLSLESFHEMSDAAEIISSESDETRRPSRSRKSDSKSSNPLFQENDEKAPERLSEPDAVAPVLAAPSDGGSTTLGKPSSDLDMFCISGGERLSVSEEPSQHANPMLWSRPFRWSTVKNLRPRSRTLEIDTESSLAMREGSDINETHHPLTNARLFFLDVVRDKVRIGAYENDSDEFFSKAFLLIFDPLKFMMGRLDDEERRLPYITMCSCSLMSIIFASLIAHHEASRDSAGDALSWFVPRFVQNKSRIIDPASMERWGAATRCLVTSAGQSTRIVTTSFVHYSSNSFCCDMAGMTLWGSYVESRYGHVRFASISILGLLGGNMLGLASAAARQPIVGMGGAVATYANIFLFDLITSNKRFRGRAKRIIVLLTCFFFVYTVISETSNSFTVQMGGTLATVLPCYLIHNVFVSEKIDVIIATAGFVGSVIYFIAVPVSMHAKGCD